MKLEKRGIISVSSTAEKQTCTFYCGYVTVVGISTGGFVSAEAKVIMPVRVEQDIGKLDLSLTLSQCTLAVECTLGCHWNATGCPSVH